MTAAPMILLAAMLLTQAPAGPRPEEPPPPPTDSFRPDPAWKPLGQDAWFDPKAKSLVLRCRVALQDGILEHLLCRKGTKEHESVLSTEAAPKMIHAGLLLAGATPGHPVRYEPRYEAPAGSPVAIEVRWDKDGATRKADAREWVKDQATGKPLTIDWVFAGSDVFQDPRTKATIYAADDGDLFTVANFPASILDLPIRSSPSDADRSFVANPDKVPPRGTSVTLYLRPRPAPVAPGPK